MCNQRNTKTIACSVAVMVMALAACTSRGEDPLIHDPTWGSFLTFSNSTVDVVGTTASRRLIILRNNLEAANDGSDKRYVLTFCAEPPPDVGEALSAALATSLQGAVEATPSAGPEARAVVAGAFARELATQIGPLLYRTQGLQLYRDAQFGLCNDVMSGYVQKGEYLEQKTKRFKEAVELIKLELPLVVQLQKMRLETIQVDSSRAKTMSDVIQSLHNILDEKSFEQIVAILGNPNNKPR